MAIPSLSLQIFLPYPLLSPPDSLLIAENLAIIIVSFTDIHIFLAVVLSFVVTAATFHCSFHFAFCLNGVITRFLFSFSRLTPTIPGTEHPHFVFSERKNNRW